MNSRRVLKKKKTSKTLRALKIRVGTLSKENTPVESVRTSSVQRSLNIIRSCPLSAGNVYSHHVRCACPEAGREIRFSRQAIFQILTKRELHKILPSVFSIS